MTELTEQVTPQEPTEFRDCLLKKNHDRIAKAVCLKRKKPLCARRKCQHYKEDV